MRKVMAMVDCDGAVGRRAKGHTEQVVSTMASATGAADQGVTDLVQDGHTWWVVEQRGDRRQAVVYIVEKGGATTHGMGWEVKEVRVERAEEVREKAALQALKSEMGRCAQAEEMEDIREQIRLALEWVAAAGEGSSRGG